jgi:hypothetical protein
MHRLTNFAHRHNSDGSYDSICTKCYATVASLGKKRLCHRSNQHTSATHLPFIWPSEVPSLCPYLCWDWSHGAAQEPTNPGRPTTSNSLSRQNCAC